MSSTGDPAPTDPEVNQSSVSGLVSTLVPTLVIALVYIAIFLLLRRSQRRFYAPRTYLGTLREQERSPVLPTGLFNWFGTFWKLPDTYALQHQSLDAYLFLRFMRICATIAFVGCLITWPILFPINATGKGGGEGLNLLTFGNVETETWNGRNKLFAHALVGWIFYAFVMIMICRESIFYINLRQAFLLSPIYSHRISSKTVLFVSVPEPYLHESKLRKVFGKSVKRVWITRETKKLDELVQERDKVAFKLEGAETKLIKLANKERLAQIKKNKGAAADEQQQPVISHADAESGSLAARWVPTKKRPTHRTGKFGLYGPKVDTINWCRERLETLIPETNAAQQTYRSGKAPGVGAVFIEFNEQSDAQTAYQTLSHHQALHMSPKYIGMHPDEIVWASLKVSWWQRVLRRYVVVGIIAALILFWAIPVAGVGAISNVPQLMKLSWLTWLEKVPSQIIGVISGLLPSVLLSVLMSLVPIIMRILAKLSGEPTLARVELFTQNAYFAFQVIQVFLVVTLGSGAAAVAQDIADNPGGTPALLASKLPLASNFYISYFILQGLTLASGVVSQVVGFILFNLFYKFFTSTPRSMYNRWTNLSAISWGSVLPVYANIVVIAIVYSLIAPLVLGFATIAICLFYLAYRYNILFVTDSQIDTKGLIYPRALQHLTVGVYISQICMIGLFGVSKSPGPAILSVIALIATALFHISMNNALGTLLYNLPRSLEVEEESLLTDLTVGDGKNADQAEKRIETLPAPHKKPNLITKFFKPHIYSDYATLRRLVPHDLVNVNELYRPEIESEAYHPPTVKSETPLLWIPRDAMGISAQEIQHTNKVIPITDEGAGLDEKNRVTWEAQNSEGARPPIWEEKIYY